MYSPAEVARRYVETGKSKAALPVGRMLLLGMLAGAFIALAGGSATFAVSYGGRLAGAAVFPAGLAMVLLAGSELFTGNCLLVIPLLERQLTWGRMLRSWGVVYLANVLGAGLVAALGTEESFIGSNGAGQIVGLFRECNAVKAEAILEVLDEQIQEYNSLNPDYAIEYRAASATSDDEKEFNIRDLLRCAFKKLRDANKPQPETAHETV